MQESQHPLSLYLLGIPKIRVYGHTLLIRRRLVRACLYYLALHKEGVSRDQLAALLAPDIPQRTARRRLSQLIWHLREALGPEGPTLVRADIEHVQLAPSCWVDVHQFLRAVKYTNIPHQGMLPYALQELTQAVELYRGEFLQGFSLPRHRELEEWILLQRERLSLLYLRALITLAHAYSMIGAVEQALTYARQALALDPIREDVHRLLMQLYALTGQREKALAQYEKCVLLLERELGLDPTPDTIQVYRAILERRYPSHGTTDLATPRFDASGVFSNSPQERFSRTPFIGRERHLEYLHRIWQRVEAEGGQIVFVRGEAGIGKTRLVREFALQEGCPLLVGQGNPSRISSPYYPLAVALRRLLPDIRRPELHVSSAVLSEVSRILPELRTYFPEVPFPPWLNPGEGSAHMFEALLEFLRGTIKSPHVLFIDDAHWLSSTLWEWFSFLLPHLDRLPILFLFVYRTEEADTALSSFVERALATGHATLLDLKGLTRHDVVRLVSSVRRKTGYPAAPLGDYLYRLTGGNCLFVLETLRWLEEHEKLGARTPLPERVQEVIQHRIGLLPSFARRILEAAAVLSPYITLELLTTTVGGDENHVIDVLDMLTERGMLSVETGRALYEFSHEQLRLVVYAVMNSATRQRLHRRAAEALQALQPPYVADLEVVLAYHWEAAGEHMRAIEALVAAMPIGDRQFAYQYVIELADKTLGLLSRLPDGKSPEQAKAKLQALFWRGRANRALRRYDLAHEDLGKARTLAEVLDAVDMEARASEELIHIAVDCWDLDRALSLAEEYLKLAHRQNTPELMGRALYLRAFVAVHARRQVDDADLQRALNIFKRERNITAMAEVWNLRGVRDMMAGHYQTALAALETGLDLARHAHHVFLMHRIQANRGHVYYNMGDFQRAMAAFTRAEEWLRALGVTRPDVLYEIGRGYTALHLGQSDDAEYHLTHATELARQMASEHGWAIARFHLAHLRLLQGRESEAFSFLQEALSHQAKLYEGTSGLMFALYGALLRHRGDLLEAFSIHRRALQRTSSPLSFRARGVLLCEFGWDVYAKGRASAAERIFQWALQLGRRKQDKVIEVKALTGLAAVHSDDAEWAQEALEIARRTGSLLLLAEAGLVALRVFVGLGKQDQVASLVDELRPRLHSAGWHAPLEDIETVCRHFVERPLLH